MTGQTLCRHAGCPHPPIRRTRVCKDHSSAPCVVCGKRGDPATSRCRRHARTCAHPKGCTAPLRSDNVGDLCSQHRAQAKKQLERKARMRPCVGGCGKRVRENARGGFCGPCRRARIPPPPTCEICGKVLSRKSKLLRCQPHQTSSRKTCAGCGCSINLRASHCESCAAPFRAASRKAHKHYAHGWAAWLMFCALAGTRRSEERQAA